VIAEFLRRIRYIVTLRQREAELAEEMEFHRSMTAPAAFGSSALAQNRSRDVWIPPWLQDVVHDLRFAARLLVKERGFTLVAVTVLAVGIGIAMLQLVLIDAVCIRGLPIPGVDRVLFLGGRDSHDRDVTLSFREFDDVRQTLTDASGVAAFASAPAVLGDEGRAPDRVLVTYVSAPMFELLQERPLVGRDFESGDDRVGATPVAILTAGVWRSRYGGDRSLVGRAVRINGTPTTIVGIMRDRFRFPNVTDVWLPLSAMPGITTERRLARSLSVIARMSGRGTLTEIRTALAAEADRLSRTYPATNAGMTLTAMRINDRYNGRLTDSVWIAFAGVGCVVLLIACANAAALLLMRAARRGHEIAVRASLGASRGRIARQLLVESALLAALGGGAGATLSALGLRAINSIIPDNTLAYWVTFALDVRGLGFLIAMSAATVLLFGFAPALHLARTDVSSVIKSGSRTGFATMRGQRWTTICLTVECGLTMVMLAGLTLGVRSVRENGRKFFVVNPANVLTTWVTLPADRYRSADARRSFYRVLQERIANIPNVSTVAMATTLPLGGAAPRTLAIDGRTLRSNEAPPTVWTVTISPQYFAAVGAPLARGRDFDDRDGLPGYESAIVNQRFVDLFFPAGDPIGRRFRLPDPNVPPSEAASLTIVGVAPTIRQRATSADADPIVYLPLSGAPPVSAVMFVRSLPDSRPIAPLVREAARALDRELPLYRTMPMNDALDVSQWNARVSNVLLYGIAFAAIALATIGLYAVIAHAVLERTREIGIRVALGARRARLVGLVAGRAVLHLLLGTGAGIGCVFGFERLIAAGGGQTATLGHQLTDPLTLTASAVLLAIVTIAASIVPAWNAARVDPVAALRFD